MVYFYLQGELVSLFSAFWICQWLRSIYSCAVAVIFPLSPICRHLYDSVKKMMHCGMEDTVFPFAPSLYAASVSLSFDGKGMLLSILVDDFITFLAMFAYPEPFLSSG